MVNGNKNDDESSCKKYGVPLYGAAWAPLAAGDSDSTASSKMNGHVVLAGGGGEGRSGIPNALIVSAFDVDSNFLSDQPVSLSINEGAFFEMQISLMEFVWADLNFKFMIES